MRNPGTVCSASCSITNEIAQQHGATSIGDGVFLLGQLLGYFDRLVTCVILALTILAPISSALHIILLFEDK